MRIAFDTFAANTVALLLAVAISACAGESGSEEHEGMTPESAELTTPTPATSAGGSDPQLTGGETREGEATEEGEEPTEYIGYGETWEDLRQGMKLVLDYWPTEQAFIGTVENTTESTICAVRVEVRLQAGPELGPTPQVDLAPGQSIPIRVPSEGASVTMFSAHPGSSTCGSWETGAPS